MKLFLAALFVLTSVSAFAKVCELRPVLSAEADRIMLYMEDQDSAEADDELIVNLMGGNPNKLDCEKLVKEIIKSGRRTVEIDGEQTPIQLKVTRTIDL